jgi:hypothetical protein
MRGSLQYDDAKVITVPERRIIKEYLESRLEEESKKTHPIY